MSAAAHRWLVRSARGEFVIEACTASSAAYWIEQSLVHDYGASDGEVTAVRMLAAGEEPPEGAKVVI